LSFLLSTSSLLVGILSSILTSSLLGLRPAACAFFLFVVSRRIFLVAFDVVAARTAPRCLRFLSLRRFSSDFSRRF
jgi:hypothetical protein